MLPELPADFNSAEPTGCDQRLAAIAAIKPMPRLIGPGACGGSDMVELEAVLMPDRSRIDLTPPPVLRCAMAESLAAWIRDEAAPRVAATGAALRSVDTYDDFECRGRNRVVGAKLSEHGKGNAVDVRAFTLADGHVIDLTDMTAPKDLREGLRESACAPLHHRARAGLRRLSRKPYPSRSGRTPQRLSHVPMGRARAAAAAHRSRRRPACQRRFPLPCRRPRARPLPISPLRPLTKNCDFAPSIFRSRR